MDRDTEQEVIRRAYAKRIMATIGVSSRQIEDAFAAVKREDFLEGGPWQRHCPGARYVARGDAGPASVRTGRPWSLRQSG
jgi:hypothetical protein